MTGPRRPDVALLVASLQMGGAERSAVRSANGLAERGLAVELVVVRGGGPLTAEIGPAVRLVDLGARRTAAALPALAAYLRRQRPRALESRVTHTNVVALLAARLAPPTPVVVEEVGSLEALVAQSRLARDRLLPGLVRRLYPSAAAVLANGHGVAQGLVALCPRLAGRIEVLHHPIVGPRLGQGAAVPVEDGWFGPGCPPVVVAVARLAPEKDLSTLLKAVARLRGGGRQVRLLVLGEGGERGRLEAEAGVLGLILESDVRLPGADLNPYRFMVRAAVVVLSSRTEGLPTALVEALALGTPVVATDCPSGPREVLGDGRFGRLVPVGDPVALAAAIEDVLDRPPPPPPREAWERYSVDQASAAHHDMLRKVWRDDATSRHSRS